MKKILYIFPIILVIIMQLSAICTEAKSPQKNDNDIMFEKLAGTETADKFNQYKNEIIEILKKEMRPHLKKQINAGEIDFNNENIVKGVKINYGISIIEGIKGIKEIKRSEEENEQLLGFIADGAIDDDKYCWEIVITINNTAIFARIFPNNSGINIGQNCFGENYEWEITEHRSAAIFADSHLPKSVREEASGWYNAEQDIRSLVKADSGSKIKAVFSNNMFFDGIIIYINNIPEYILTDKFYIPHSSDDLIDGTPENITDHFNEISSNISENNLLKLNYNECIENINTYFKYRIDTYSKYKVTSEDIRKYFSENKGELVKAIKEIPGISEMGENISVAVSEPFIIPAYIFMGSCDIYEKNNFSDEWYSLLFADGKACKILIYDIYPEKHLEKIIDIPDELSENISCGNKYSLFKVSMLYATDNYGEAFGIAEEIYFAAGNCTDNILISQVSIHKTKNQININNFLSDSTIFDDISKQNIISRDMPVTAKYIYKSRTVQ